MSMSVLSLLFACQTHAQEVVENPVAELEVLTDVNEILAPVQSVEIKSDDSETIVEDQIIVTATSSSSTSTSPVEMFAEDAVLMQESKSTQDSVHIFIRNGEQIVLDTSADISSDTIKIIDTVGVEHSISSKSVLGILKQVDTQDDSFDISDIQYYESFGSLYLKCITINSQKVCDNWQFVVNGLAPFTSIDGTLLKDGDTLGLYFGSPYQIVFDTSLYSIDAPIWATSQVYDYQTNKWNPRTGVILGVTVTNPLDMWNPIELTTQQVDLNGRASFTIATSGVYMIGVKDDWYYPLYSITVSSTTATTTATSTDIGTSGGSGTKNNTFDIPGAISFLKSLQASNGSFGGSELYTDWVAIAFGAAGEQNSSLIGYLKSKSKVKDIVTDNERRAMALLALGENPYNFAGINYIEAITTSFDGTQFGEKQLVNDDIFALVVLSKVGYTSNDEIIKKTISFIIGKQNSNGSWEGSVDLTSAAIQALQQFKSLSQVSNSISSAKAYLIKSQNSDGGWGSVYSTGWTMQAMASLGENWKVGAKTPEDYLISMQQKDGGVLTPSDSDQNRIWATSYAIPAVMQKPWGEILQSVGRPKIDTSTTATSTSSNLSNKDDGATSTDTMIVVEDLIQEEATTTPVVLKLDSSKKEIRLENNTSEQNLEKKQNEEEIIKVEEQEVNQLAAVNSVPFLRTWWVYIGGLFVLIGITVGVKYWKL